MKNKTCVLILPYFGKFNSYFSLFLRSFSYNTEFDLLLFTDSDVSYNYPKNVKVIKSELGSIKKRAEEKFGFEISLNNPYKLCDYKPAYGFLFEEYIQDYKYWGHCDCDLIFGNLNQMLLPLINQDYDKLFAAGHLTLYKNTTENIRRFMKEYQGRLLYKEAFTTDDIYIFDEGIKGNSVHHIFLEDGAKVYEGDISVNVTSHFARFRRSHYNPEKRKFTWDPFKCIRYYWTNGDIIAAEYDSKTKKVEYTNYIYMHLQLRKMRMKQSVLEKSIIQILPDRFVPAKKIPENKKDMNILTVGCPYLYWFDVYVKKFKKKLATHKNS